MIDFRTVTLPVAAASLAVLAWSGASWSEPGAAAQVAAKFGSMLGSGAPAARAERLAFLLTVPSGNPDVRDESFFTLLKDVGSPGSPKYEAGGATLALHLSGHESLRVENSRVVIVPSADGRSARFELSGSPFGASSKLTATGTVEWAAGPGGGDGLDLDFQLDAPVEAVRAWIPERIDPHFSGTLSVGVKAHGVVGEMSTEDAPATPLRGEYEASVDLSALGRTSPFTTAGQFSLDDRMVRINAGTVAWQGLSYPLKGWFAPKRDGEYQLTMTYKDVDAKKIATDWNVPEAWRPTATLSGELSMAGKPGKGYFRYVAKTPAIDVPGIEGNTIHLDNVRLQGGLLEINADVAMSVRADRVVVRGIDLGPMPVGIRWWQGDVHVNTSHTSLWGGESDGSVKYTPAIHPTTSFHGRVRNAKAAEMVRNLATDLGIDADGVGSFSFAFARDQSWKDALTVHASITTGRLGGIDLFARTLAALAEADSALTLAADAQSLVPKPRAGAGTRIDRFFFEAERQGDLWELGGLYLKASPVPNAPAFQLDADGRFSREAGLELDGTMLVPAEIAARLQASAPWVAPLRKNDLLFVPVIVRGPLASLSLELTPAFRETLARAKRGEPVEAAGAKQVRHVGAQGLAIIPADPASLEQQ